MINNTPESKLDTTVKNTLNSYEAPYDASDWSRMESMLDQAPKSSTFKWSYAVTVIIGVIVIGGSYALYNAFGTSKGTSTKEVNTAPPVVSPETTIPKATSPPPPAVTTTTVTVPVPKPQLPVIATPDKEVTKTVTPENKPAAPAEKVTAKEGTVKVKKADPKETPVIESHDKIVIMGNEPIFGDMLDSSKGIIHTTKEKEETKKAAADKKNTPVGWNQFMTPHMNIDSMRKVREQRDSLKTE